MIFVVKTGTMALKITTIKTVRYCYINATFNGERVGKVCIDLDADDANRYVKAYGGNFAKIIIVETSSAYRGMGIATAMLNKAIEVLNDYNLYLNVIPMKRDDGDKDKNQLIDFYSKFGFKKYDADICTTTMIRIAD
jgi:ribosomal protein S18 acetylase RimI-like enzyme